MKSGTATILSKDDRAHRRVDYCKRRFGRRSWRRGELGGAVSTPGHPLPHAARCVGVHVRAFLREDDGALVCDIERVSTFTGPRS